jgi:hypothetical protein
VRKLLRKKTWRKPEKGLKANHEHVQGFEHCRIFSQMEFCLFFKGLLPMSMEYNVYAELDQISDDLIALIVSELNRFDMTCEIHPDISFADSPGLVPFKFRLHTSQIPGLVEKDLPSGVEISIEDFDADEQNNPFFGSIQEDDWLPLHRRVRSI